MKRNRNERSCKKCGHTWLRNEVLTDKSYVCEICGIETIGSIYAKAFLRKNGSLLVSHPDLASEVHPTRNIGITSESVHMGTQDKIWWMGRCGHEWLQSPYKRVSGCGCNELSCINKTIGQKSRDRATDRAKSLWIDHENIAREIHPIKNGSLVPENATTYHPGMIWWIDEFGHEWKSTLKNRMAGNGCSVCAGRTIQPGFNDLLSQNPALSKQLHPTKNLEDPTKIGYLSTKKYWWLGKCGHEWFASPYSRVNAQNDCKFCVNESKPEAELRGYLKSQYPHLTVTKDNTLLGGNREIDIYLPDINVGIEMNGDWWHSQANFDRFGGNSIEYHADKRNRASRKSVILVFVWEHDWNYANDSIKLVLEELIKSKRVHPILNKLSNEKK